MKHIHLYLNNLACCCYLLLLAGCTAGSVEEIVPEEVQPVELSFGKPDLGEPVILTRAGTAPTPLPAGSTVRIAAYFTGRIGETYNQALFSTTAPLSEATYVVGADGALLPCLVNDSGQQIAGEARGLIVRGGVFDFYAVSPARRLAKASDNNYKITDIPHKEDVMTAFARGVTVSKNSHVVTLGTFRRKCALVVFNVAPSPDNALPFETLYGTKLELKKISSSGASLIAGEDTGIPLTGGSTEADAQVVFAEDEFEPVASGLGDIGLNKTMGILIPKNNRPFEVAIEVRRDKEVATLKATIDKNITFDEGKRYVFTLEVKNNESSLLMRILHWNMVNFTDTGVGSPDNPYPDPDIYEGIGTTITVAVWSEIRWYDADVGEGDNSGPIINDGTDGTLQPPVEDLISWSDADVGRS